MLSPYLSNEDCELLWVPIEVYCHPPEEHCGNPDLLSNLELYISKCCTNTNSMTFKISCCVKLIIWFIPFLAPVPSRIWLWKAVPAECPHWHHGLSLSSSRTPAYGAEHKIPPPNLPAPEKAEGVLVCQKQNSVQNHTGFKKGFVR